MADLSPVLKEGYQTLHSSKFCYNFTSTGDECENDFFPLNWLKLSNWIWNYDLEDIAKKRHKCTCQ